MILSNVFFLLFNYWIYLLSTLLYWLLSSYYKELISFKLHGLSVWGLWDFFYVNLKMWAGYCRTQQECVFMGSQGVIIICEVWTFLPPPPPPRDEREKGFSWRPKPGQSVWPTEGNIKYTDDAFRKLQIYFTSEKTLI